MTSVKVGMASEAGLEKVRWLGALMRTWHLRDASSNLLPAPADSGCQPRCRNHSSAADRALHPERRSCREADGPHMRVMPVIFGTCRK